MFCKWKKIALSCCFFLAGQVICRNARAGNQDPQEGLGSSSVTVDAKAEMKVETKVEATKIERTANPAAAEPSSGDYEPPIEKSNSLGASFLKHLVSDQKTIWTSPAHLRWADASWLFPMAGVAGGFLATDRAVPPALPASATKLNRYSSVSNYALYSVAGAGAGLYIWGKLTHDDHRRETGILAGEAAIDSLAVDTSFGYSLGRERPNQDHGRGNFFRGGDSFPSDHSAVAWSIASVIAHEYPGPLTQIAAYGLATAVSATRVLGAQHFPSDVVVGGAIGWLIGRQVYRAHHDPEVGGGGWDGFPGAEFREDQRDRRDMGSPFVPLDSWVYAAFERLAALGYINTDILGLKPWTRMECARLAQEAAEALQQAHDGDEGAARLQLQVAREFSYETNLLGGGRNFTASLESVYARTVSISGPPLTDGYHFGQTVSYDFGRPFERGINGQAGGSFSAAAGPLVIYVRAEYQHAPGAPILSDNVRNLIAQIDGVNLSQVRSGPLAAVNRIQLLDTYAAVNLDNWQIVLGRQSLSWTPGPDGSMLWSDNIEPVDMVRIVNPEPLRLPGFLQFLGPVRMDQFFGRLQEHAYIARPFEFGQKINVKPFPFLELGFARTMTIGGAGSIYPLTTSGFLGGFFGIVDPRINDVPGHNQTEMDWTFYVPKVRHILVLYGDSYADDDILPIENPARNPWHPGIYLTRIPGISKLDFHMEGVSTETGTVAHSNNFNSGQLNYTDGYYLGGYTINGNIIGNTVGREGRAIRGWLTYWVSPQNTLQLSYQHNTVNADFIPQGGAWQDYGLRSETHFRGVFYMKAAVQLEHISRFPVLFNGPQNNVTASLEIGFTPGRLR
jgi:membrane-associated phospholipid phosphatase